MKYSYFFLMISVSWGCYIYFDADSLNTKQLIIPYAQGNILKQEKNNVQNFTSNPISKIFHKSRIKNLAEVHDNDNHKIIFVKENNYNNKMRENPRDLHPLLDHNEEKANTLLVTKVGYENEFGEGVAVPIYIGSENVGSDNNFGEGIVDSVDSFTRKTGYDNEYGEGVAENIDPILEELIANTPQTASQSENGLGSIYD